MVPPAVTVQVPEKAPPPPPPPPVIPPGQSGTTVAPPPAVTETKMPGPPKKKRKTPKKPPRPDTEATPGAGTQAGAPATPPAQEPAASTVPQLGQMLSDDQRRDYEAHIHDSLDRARANLQKARNSKLTEAQQRMASQVETFIAQAEERRKTDLVSSRSLAERAELLSRDLAESLQ
jgi:hypothetical protein